MIKDLCAIVFGIVNTGMRRPYSLLGAFILEKESTWTKHSLSDLDTYKKNTTLGKATFGRLLWQWSGIWKRKEWTDVVSFVVSRGENTKYLQVALFWHGDEWKVQAQQLGGDKWKLWASGRLSGEAWHLCVYDEGIYSECGGELLRGVQGLQEDRPWIKRLRFWWNWW